MEEELSCDLIRQNEPEFHAYLEQKLRYLWAEEDRNKNAAVLKKLHEQSSGFGIGRGPDFSVKELIVQDNAVLIRCSSEESNLAYEHVRYMFHIEKGESESKMALHTKSLESLKEHLVDASDISSNEDNQRSASLQKPSNQVEMLAADKSAEKESLSTLKRLANPSLMGRNAKHGGKVSGNNQMSKNVGKIQEKREKVELSVKTAESSTIERKPATAARLETSSKRAYGKMPKDLKLIMTGTGNNQTGNREAVGQDQSIPKGIDKPKGRNPVSIMAKAASKKDVKRQGHHPRALVREKTVDIKISKIRNPMSTKSGTAAQLKNQTFKKDAAGQNESNIIVTASGETVGSESLNVPSQMRSKIPVPFKNHYNINDESGNGEYTKKKSQTAGLYEDESDTSALGSIQSGKSGKNNVQLVDTKPKVASLLSKTNLLMPKCKNPMNHSPAIIAKWNYQNPKGETKIGYNNPKSIVPLKKDERDMLFQASTKVVKAQQENCKISEPLTPGRYHTPRGEIQAQNMNLKTLAPTATFKSQIPKTTAKRYGHISETRANLPDLHHNAVPLEIPKAKTAVTITKGGPSQTAKTQAKSEDKSAKATASLQKYENPIPQEQGNVGNAQYQTPDDTGFDTPRNSNYLTPRNTRYQTPRKSILKDIVAKKGKQLP